MTTKVKLTLEITALLIFCLAFAAFPVFAGGYDRTDQDQKQGQAQGQAQGQVTNVKTKTKSEATATADATVYSEGGSGGAGGEGGSASSSNEGITVDASEATNIENNSSNIVLVPNNNTENCLRVIGLAFGKNGESAAFGWPFRSKKCDYEGAADDAFAAGERELGWFWKCENPNLYKSFKDKGDTADTAKRACLDQMVGGVTAIKTITSLTEQLEFSEEERRIAREKHQQSVERLTSACDESKDRILQACVTGK